ncbi:LysR family transcriptional regulator [Skermanella sp. TT6]|uniref:LysR family transcriptional regulator n=1 Tax=Skermanella cutis TaxID=2775420 RepID=A0ABX7BBI8_9PROT|nr:LysR family transcriptional regulator [Skermanella sp. TT6]QQP90663.1 LysR family transcriptional regulator [Skermanella sp. TT6]
MNFDFRHVRGFITLAEELHFGRAAQRLNMTQPGLSRLIGELERHVKVPLFRRTTRTVDLTEAGKVFLAQCRIGIDHFERAVAQARRTAGGELGTVRVGYMDFAINGRLPEFIRAFARHRPEVRLELFFLSTQQQHAALLADRIDVGFMIGAFDSEHVENYAFDTDRYVALLPITHPLSNVRNLRLADFANEPFVLGSGENWGAYRSNLFDICHHLGFHPNIVQEASSSEGIFGLVAAGTGVSVYAGCVRNLQRRGIVIRDLDDVRQPIPTCAAWLKPVQSPSVEIFIRVLTSVWG